MSHLTPQELKYINYALCARLMSARRKAAEAAQDTENKIYMPGVADGYSKAAEEIAALVTKLSEPSAVVDVSPFLSEWDFLDAPGYGPEHPDYAADVKRLHAVQRLLAMSRKELICELMEQSSQIDTLSAKSFKMNGTMQMVMPESMSPASARISHGMMPLDVANALINLNEDLRAMLRRVAEEGDAPYCPAMPLGQERCEQLHRMGILVECVMKGHYRIADKFKNFAA